MESDTITPKRLAQLTSRCRKTYEKMDFENCKQSYSCYTPRQIAEAMYLWASIHNVPKDGWDYTINNY